MAAPTPEQIAALRAADHEDERTQFIAGNIVVLSVAIISVALRFLSRRVARTHYGADDWTIVASTILVSAYTALLFANTAHGMGRHVWWLDSVKTFSQLAMSAEAMYNSAIPFIKASILLLYARIFPQKWFHHTLLGLGIFIVSYSVAQIFADIFQCVPIASIWGEVPKEHCINYPLLIKVCGVINILTDVVMLAMPMPLLWKLKLSTARKKLLMGLFLIGGLACVASIVRLFYVDKIGNSEDPTWDYTMPALVANTELCVGILSANLPTYRPLITSLRPSGKSATDTKLTSKAAGSTYGRGQDSLNIPLHSLFSQTNASTSEADDEEKLFANAEHKTHTYASKDGTINPGSKGNEIRVTTSFNTSRR